MSSGFRSRQQRRGRDKKKYQREGLSQEEVEELKEAFDLFDADGGGTIDSAELKAAMESLGYDKKNRVIVEMIESMDDGEIDFDGFLDMMTARMSDSREDILKVFALFDENNQGVITVDDLRRVASTLGDTMTDAELQEMITRGDTNKNGVIDPDEFVQIMMASYKPQNK